MLTVEVINDSTGPDEAANYDYLVQVNGREIARGRVVGHDRSRHWSELLVRIAIAGATDLLGDDARRGRHFTSCEGDHNGDCWNPACEIHRPR